MVSGLKHVRFTTFGMKASRLTSLEDITALVDFWVGWPFPKQDISYLTIPTTTSLLTSSSKIWSLPTLQQTGLLLCNATGLRKTIALLHPLNWTLWTIALTMDTLTWLLVCVIVKATYGRVETAVSPPRHFTTHLFSSSKKPQALFGSATIGILFQATMLLMPR